MTAEQERELTLRENQLALQKESEKIKLLGILTGTMQVASSSSEFRVVLQSRYNKVLESITLDNA